MTKSTETSSVAATNSEQRERGKPRGAWPAPCGQCDDNTSPLLRPAPFTLKQLKDSIPPHCFERSALRSLAYVAVDLLHVFLLCFLASHIDDVLADWPPLVRWGAWGVYWIYQGIVLTGLWVCAHECGHQAFSESQTLNDAVGLVLHTALLVPYHPWRISHAKHHMNTGHLERDEVFVPNTRTEAGVLARNDTLVAKALRSAPLVAARIFLMLSVGWPAYLLTNVSGRKSYNQQNQNDNQPQTEESESEEEVGSQTTKNAPSSLPVNHFSPDSPIFAPKDRWDVLVSDAALVTWLGILTAIAISTGLSCLIKMYVVPYLFVNMWLVLITCLQHTDKEIPHFKGEEWTWLRGALCTVDRSYSKPLNVLLHHIGDTHVCHHLFSKIPHYHAEEATEALKTVLGEYYRRDDTPIGVALWRSMGECVFVEDGQKIAWYKSE